MTAMSATSIEVTIQDGKIEPVDPHQLPMNGRGWLTISTPAAIGDEPRVWVEPNADGLPVFHTNGPVLTSEMVKQIEASTA